MSPGASAVEEPTEMLSIEREAVNEMPVTCPHATAVQRIRANCLQSPAADVSPLERADGEELIEGWLVQRGIDERYSAALAETSVTITMLDDLARAFSSDKLGAAVQWIATGCHARALARHVEDASSRVHNLVSTLKRITYMDRATAPEPLDLHQGLSDTLAMLAHKARSKSASLTVNAPENLPRAIGIGGELNQVWMNLIDNALDAVSDGGRVAVTARVEGPNVVVRVTDDGPGIPKELERRIFDPFFTTKPVGQGVGMGLEIVRRFVESNNGRLDFESRPGSTEFRVALPSA